MNNEKRLTKKDVINFYSSKLNRNNKYELWEKCKWFKAYWNIDASDFARMLTMSLRAAGFIENQWWNPIYGIVDLARNFDKEEEVKTLFKNLFSYQGDGRDTLQTRIENFISGANKLSSVYWRGRTKYYQDIQTASLYLFLYDPTNNYWYIDNFNYSRFEEKFQIDDFNIDFNKFYQFCDGFIEEIKADNTLYENLMDTHIGFNCTLADYHILISDILKM